ncbi:MAG: hypothetical protein WC806_01980 [Candidatus Gracilibacteria bacterium]|jgi:hypothetical protein
MEQTDPRILLKNIAKLFEEEVEELKFDSTSINKKSEKLASLLK